MYPHGDAGHPGADAVNAELKSRGMEPDARIFCELLNVEDRELAGLRGSLPWRPPL